jgi:O-antigen/teichoic acid export membrane protein
LADSKILLNTAANFGGRIASGFLSVAVVPIYVRWLGGEAYGLIAFAAAMQGMLSLLDFGLATTANREVSRLSASGDPVASGTLVQTLAAIYWCIAAIVALGLGIAAPLLARHWLNVSVLPADTVTTALLLSAGAVALRWPVALYNGVLQGREQQLTMNSIMVGHALARVLGAIGVIMFVSRTIEAVFAWQLVVAGSEVVTTRYLAWKALPQGAGATAHFDRSVLIRVWRFALSFSLVGAAGTLLSNMGSLLMSKFLPLEQLGVYSMVASLAALLPAVGVAVAVATFPKFARITDKKEATTEIGGALGISVSLVLVLVVPANLFLVFFCEPLVAFWSGSAAIARESLPVGIILSCAGCLNALSSSYYSLLVAKGETRWLMATNFVNILLFFPYYLIGLPKYGLWFAALGWLLQNIIQGLSSIYRANKIYSVDGTRRSILTWRSCLLWIGAAAIFFAVADSMEDSDRYLLRIGVGVLLTSVLILIMSIENPNTRGFIPRPLMRRFGLAKA